MCKYNFFAVIIFALVLFNSANAQNGWHSQINPLGFGEEAMVGRVEFVSLTEGWISGSRGTLLHTTDAGLNWVIVNPWTQDSLWSGSDPGYVMDWVGSTHGWKLDNLGPVYGVSSQVFLHKTTDGGINWSRKVLSSESDDFGFKVQFVDQLNGWVLIWNFTTMIPKFLKTTDGGENWIPFNGMGIFYFKTANVGWCYSADGPNMMPPFKIYKTTDGGSNWNEQFNDNQPGMYNDIFFIDENNGWIVGNNGKVLKTKDGGTNWVYVTNSGINPNQKSKTVFFINNLIGWIPSKFIDETAFIQHTTDGGNTWSTQTVPIGNQGYNSIFSIYFTDINNGWLTADWGRICNFTITTGVDEDHVKINNFYIYPNYPNPFNPATVIRFSIPEAGNIKLGVYNILGEQIALLVDGFTDAGTFEVSWSAENVTSGVYFCRLEAGNQIISNRMVLLR